MFPPRLLLLPWLAAGDAADGPPTALTSGPSAPTLAGSAAGARGTRCLPSETALFTCPVGGGKVGSLCATSPTPPATVAWRFGSRTSLDLVFPAEPRPVAEVFRWSQYTRPAVTMEAVDFTHGAVEYGLVDSSSYERDPDGEAAQSIVVTLPDGRVVVTACRGGSAGLGGMPALGAPTVAFVH